ncbi:hypothetical protein [Streptomyces albogriseolus]|uniref:hypothetical protein n=1 Tax=Streptomyces albogriseolus TaxID=1887 RepID=UPI0036912FE5
MSEQTAVRWTRGAWDDYVEQVRETLSDPEFSPYREQPLMPPAIMYVCPLCHRAAAILNITRRQGVDSFTATWKDCGHTVSVA